MSRADVYSRIRSKHCKMLIGDCDGGLGREKKGAWSVRWMMAVVEVHGFVQANVYVMCKTS